jgi:hypothetical protein
MFLVSLDGPTFEVVQYLQESSVPGPTYCVTFNSFPGYQNYFATAGRKEVIVYKLTDIIQEEDPKDNMVGSFLLALSSSSL